MYSNYKLFTGSRFMCVSNSSRTAVHAVSKRIVLLETVLLKTEALKTYPRGKINQNSCFVNFRFALPSMHSLRRSERVWFNLNKSMQRVCFTHTRKKKFIGKSGSIMEAKAFHYIIHVKNDRFTR